MVGNKHSKSVWLLNYGLLLWENMTSFPADRQLRAGSLTSILYPGADLISVDKKKVGEHSTTIGLINIKTAGTGNH